MIAPAIFHWIVLPGVAVAVTQGKRAQAFANVTQMCENTHPSIVKKTKTLMKASEPWCSDFGRSMYSAVI